MAPASADLQALGGNLSKSSTSHRTDVTKGLTVATASTSDYLQYKVKTRRLLNQKMAKASHAVEISTIYAIMCLLSIEVGESCSSMSILLLELLHIIYLIDIY